MELMPWLSSVLAIPHTLLGVFADVKEARKAGVLPHQRMVAQLGHAVSHPYTWPVANPRDGISVYHHPVGCAADLFLEWEGIVSLRGGLDRRFGSWRSFCLFADPRALRCSVVCARIACKHR